MNFIPHQRGAAGALSSAALLSVGLLASCSGGSSASEATPDMDLLLVSNGFGQLLPHQAFETDGEGNVGTDVIDLRTLEDIYTHVSGTNPVLATPRLSEDPRLPSGAPGNQFIYAQFSNSLDVLSVLSDRPADQANSEGLTGEIVVEAVDPLTGSTNYVQGRAFINGRTFAGTPVGDPPRLPLQTWVSLENGVPTFTDIDNDSNGVPDGLGFPGTLNAFAGMANLFGDDTFVFIPDSDDNLATLETFPAGFEIRVNIFTSVLAENGKQMVRQAVAATSVGADVSSPESLFTPPPIQAPLTVPQDGDSDVDPTSVVQLFFTEPIQPATLGNFPSNRPPELSGSVQLEFGPPTTRVQVPFFVTPKSALDLTTWTIEPAFSFPGEGPEGQECGSFDTVDVIINSDLIQDLSGNTNDLAGTSSFRTGEGPGIVNAPITPDVIYAGRQGVSNSLSVIDLNGFGGGTGNPTWQYQNYAQGNSNYPNDPNVFFQGSQLLPPLLPGTCTFNGGSAGVFTLTKDSNLDDRLLRSPLVGSVDDIAIGSSLDMSFNNGPAPFGCQAGGGNLCSTTGIKTTTVTIQSGTLNPGGGAQAGAGVLITGFANLVSWSPHPNPPPLDFPPICVSPFLLTQEPTSIDTTLPPPGGPGLQNLLNPGNPFPEKTDPTVPVFNVPPTGLLAEQANSFFQGPSLPDTVQNCLQYGIRQQVGHFLYVLDRSLNEVSVLNSNRMTVVDRITIPDPTSLAMGTNLDLLAVSSQGTDAVYFIDTDPSSATFHEVIKITQVGESPRGIAWEPGNEDILVCNEASNSVSIISAFSLEVRKEIVAFLDRPFEVCITPRQSNFGLLRNVYFAYILNRSGEVAIFESGPNEVNGWGYDDVVGTTPYTFQSPKTIQPDYLDLRGGFWVLHEGPYNVLDETFGEPGEPAATNCAVVTGTAGQLPLNAGSLGSPQIRDIAFGIKVSLGVGTLSGVPVDIAFDNLLNLGGGINFSTPFSAGQPAVVNGKSLVRPAAPQSVAGCASRYVFFSIPNSSSADGAVDVVSLTNFTRFDVNPYEEGVQSIPVPGVRVIADYFRQ